MLDTLYSFIVTPLFYNNSFSNIIPSSANRQKRCITTKKKTLAFSYELMSSYYARKRKVNLNSLKQKKNAFLSIPPLPDFPCSSLLDKLSIK
ncbi:hypothetical protein CWS01_21300 [Niallia nealsonii]|uniref:Uncharacterized protein n=1 Tax=Niallia nealsonii TaxID=115979 RepID=A0A2N0YWJ4_9BACI|nr:hypothetical protein CWS01_21300 [Niallia nealsonii]